LLRALTQSQINLQEFIKKVIIIQEVLIYFV